MRGFFHIVTAIVLFSSSPVFADNNADFVYYFSHDDNNFVNWGKIFSFDSIPDSTAADSVSHERWFRIAADSLEGTIDYSAADSIVYDMEHHKTYIYHTGNVKYKTYTLKADFIIFDWDTKTLMAKIVTDSTGKKLAAPYFEDGDDHLTGDTVSYAFGTKKGKIYDFKTQQGDGYVHFEEAKKTNDNQYYGKTGYYTTCDLDHPHFYIQTEKAKVVPDKIAVTGPANLVIADVPTPLFLPFGIFPIKKGQTSGILIPQYGNDFSRGYFLRSGGYYFALSKYFDLALTGDIYSRGSWGLHTASSYVKRYRFRGTLDLDYSVNKYGLSFDPAYSQNKGFLLTWNHSQDAKAHPGSNFSANVRLGTSDYLSNNSYSSSYLTNQLSSSVSYSRAFTGTPFSLSAALRHDQNIQTHVVDLTLPEATLSMSRIYPLKKLVDDDQNPLSQFGINYTMSTRNYVSTTDSLLFQNSTLDKFQNGFSHVIATSAPVKLFKYFTLTPSFNYTENWFFQTIRKEYDPDTLITSSIDTSGETIYDTTVTLVRVDTIPGFKAARYYNMSIGLSTKLYGLLQFHGKIKAIRHVLTPTLSFNYTPDFSDPKWGYYGTYYPGNNLENVKYSIFEGGIYGSPPSGKVGSIGLSLGNNLEMKVYSKKDSIKHEKKIKLIESFSVSGSYNLAVDSLNLSDISFSGYTTLFDKVKLNVSGSFDPYVLDSSGVNINQFEWDVNHRLGRFNGGNVSLSTSFQSKRKENPGLQTNKGTEEEREMVWSDPNAYIDFNVPWSFNVSYNLRVSNIPTIGGRDSISTTQTTNFGGDVNITPNWKVQMTTGYDFQLKEFTYTSINIYRDLHCWEMSFQWIPFGLRKSYLFNLNVKSSVLQDLKLTRKRDWTEY